jgi:phage shock protein PspC (stress-responsive transcriptional regulator)
MKKTISTSIGGIVFNVEEDAHDKLAAYLDAISASLKDSEGHNEIMSDIESRIAEILQQKVNSFKQVITIAEIDEVIGIMGKPEDFGTVQGAATQQTYDTYTSGPGGSRRIYRDMDDKVIFGVCSGLSHHFGIDPIWLRLALDMAFLFGGFGLVLYILLAVIMPKARTTAEKLEMMGEPVDVNNIRRTIEEDMDHIKSKVKDFGNDFKSGRGKDRAKEFGKNLEDFFNSMGHSVGSMLGGVIKFILSVVSIFIVVLFAVLLIGLITSLTSGVNIIHVGMGHHMLHYSANSFFDMLSVTGRMRRILIAGIILFLGVPIIAVIVRFGRAAVGRKQPFQWFTIAASVLWTAGWIFMFIGIAAVFSHFSVSDFSRKDNIVTPKPNKMLYVKMDNTSIGEDVIQWDSLNVYISDADMSGEDEFRGNPSFCIEQSPDTNYHLITTKIARGGNKAEANEYAEDIDYNFTNRDSTLTLDPYFNIEITKGWRKQRLDLLLQVPVNKSVDLPAGIDHILCRALHRRGQHMGGEKWTMSQTGPVPYTK